MDRDNDYLPRHPQVWPVIATYGFVVLGVAAYSVFKSDATRHRGPPIAWAQLHAPPGSAGRNLAVRQDISPTARID